MAGNYQASLPAKAIPFDINTPGATGKFISINLQDVAEELWDRTVTNLLSAEVSATADTTTTSSTDVLMNAMTYTPAAGTYLVWFTTSVDHSNQSVAVVASIYVGGVLKTDSVRTVITRPNAIGANSLTANLSIVGKVTVNGSQAIEIRWKTTSGTATAHQRTLTGLRVS